MTRMKIFKTKEEAMQYVEELYSAVYYLSHGEAGRPSYKVKKIRNKPYFGIWVEYNFYYGTFNAKKNGFLEKEDWEV